LFYIVFAVLLIALLLYVRFPAEKFKAYCEKRIEKLVAESTCNIGKIAFGFPLSAAFGTIKISRTVGGRESAMIVDRLVITPELPHFWRTFKLTGGMYSGLFEAGLDLDANTRTFQLTDVRLTGLEAGLLAEGIGLTDRKISGVFEFRGDYQAPNNQPGNGVGEGVVEIVSGSMTLLQPMLAISTIEFEKLAVSVSQQGGVINFAEGELLGKEIIADFSGELRLAAPILNSSILLSGHLEPDDAFLRSHPREHQFVQRLLQRYKVTVLPFKIGGTVQRPLFRFST
jgi:type II secretion system protein N